MPANPTRVISVALTAALFIAWILLLRPPLLGGATSYVLVIGKSMEPSMKSGALAIVRRQRSYADGDVIAYHADRGIIIHRIVSGDARTGFITRGDNRRTADLYRPLPENIVGRLWFQIPGGGTMAGTLKQPLVFGLLVGGPLTLSLFWRGRSGRRRRPASTSAATPVAAEAASGEAASRPHASPAVPPSPGPPRAAVVLLAVCGALALLSAALAFVALRRPEETIKKVERARYDQTATYSYTARMAASTLYPDGRIGPVRAGDAGAETGRASIFTKLAESLDLDLSYALTGPAPVDVSGSVSATLEIAAASAWSRRTELLPPTSFSGASFSTRLPVNLAQLVSLIDTVEKETNYVPPQFYDITISPRIRVTGTLDDRPTDAVFSPPFTLRMTRTEIVPEGELVQRAPLTTVEMVARRGQIDLRFTRLPVTAARTLGLAGVATFGLASLALAAVAFLGLGRDEVAKIHSRYGALIVSVAAAGQPSAEVIRLASFGDLVRLAGRDNRTILHTLSDAGDQVYAVRDGATSFEYRVAARPHRAGRTRALPRQA